VVLRQCGSTNLEYWHRVDDCECMVLQVGPRLDTCIQLRSVPFRSSQIVTPTRSSRSVIYMPGLHAKARKSLFEYRSSCQIFSSAQSCGHPGDPGYLNTSNCNLMNIRTISECSSCEQRLHCILVAWRIPGVPISI